MLRSCYVLRVYKIKFYYNLRKAVLELVDLGFKSNSGFGLMLSNQIAINIIKPFTNTPGLNKNSAELAKVVPKLPLVHF